MPPTTTTTKMIEPTTAAIAGSVTKVMPPITPARPASAQPLPNTSMNTRGTLWPSASTISGCVSEAWITRPMRVRVSSSHSADQHQQRHQHHEGARHRKARALRPAWHTAAGAAPSRQAQAVGATARS